MTIGRILEDRDGTVLSCEGETTVRQAIAMLAEKRIGALPVMEQGSVAGMFSERDVIYNLASSGEDFLDRPVRDVMTAPAVTVQPETSVLAALSLMTKRRIRHLPVVADGRMVGLVSIGDLVKHRIDKIESEAEAMRSYIQMA